MWRLIEDGEMFLAAEAMFATAPPDERGDGANVPYGCLGDYEHPLGGRGGRARGRARGGGSRARAPRGRDPRRAAVPADAIVDPRHVEHPEWAMAFDEDKEAVTRTRRELLGRAVDAGLTVAASHLGAAARVERTADGFRLVA
jgi:hypothetical protein